MITKNALYNLNRLSTKEGKSNVPRNGENIQEWVNRQERNCLKDIFVSNFHDKHEWILLNSRHHQQSNNGIRFDVNVDVVLVPCARTHDALSILNNVDNGNYDLDVEQYYYLFNGEIPWGKLILDVNMNKFFKGGDRLKMYSPFAWFSWESYHSTMNDIGSVPFLSRALSVELGLKYDVNSFSFYSKDGKIITKFFNDYTSHYYFIRKDYILKFLKKYNLTLIWCEFGYKYGDFGLENKRNLSPATSRFRNAAQLY